MTSEHLPQDDERQDLVELDYSPQFKELLAAFGRRDDRHWASEAHGLSLEQIEEKVAAILIEQLHTSPRARSDMASLLEKMIAMQKVFDPLPPEEETLDLAVTHGLQDYETFQALRGLTLLGFADQSRALRRFRTIIHSGLVVEPRTPGGPKAGRDLHRNMVIVTQIEQMRQLGIEPTRSAATRDERSGCDVVSRGMSKAGQAMSYPAIEAIWKRRNDPNRLAFMGRVLTMALTEMLRKGRTSEK